MTYICNPSAPVNGDATPSRQKFRLQDKLHGDRRLTDAERCVGYFIIDWYGIGGRNYTFTRHDRLAEYTGLDVRTVRRSIAKLVALGYITIRTRGRWGRASEYVPIFLPVYEDIPMSSCSPHMRTGQSAHEDIAMSEHEDKAMSTHTLPTRSANEGLVVSPPTRGSPLAGLPRAAREPTRARRMVPRCLRRSGPYTRARKAAPSPGKLLTPRWRAACRSRPSSTARGGTRRRKLTLTRTGSSFRQRGCATNAGSKIRSRRVARSRSPERAPKANGNAASDRAPRASKANGKAEPPTGSLDETEPFEIFEDDDGWSDDPERIQPEAIEMGFSRDRCVRLKSNGRKGQVLGAVMGDDPQSRRQVFVGDGLLEIHPHVYGERTRSRARENPTPEERVATAAAAEKRAKRLATVRRRDGGRSASRLVRAFSVVPMVAPAKLLR